MTPTEIDATLVAREQRLTAEIANLKGQGLNPEAYEQDLALTIAARKAYGFIFGPIDKATAMLGCNGGVFGNTVEVKP